MATGHYARVSFRDDMGRWCVTRGVDPRKDQSYALYSLTQEQLAHTLLPLGEYEKTETRAIAERLGLRVAKKPDSQEICFVPDNDYGRFLQQEAPDILQPGNIVDRDNRPVGRHAGVAFYTIGQRRRLQITVPEARYVTELDAATNTVKVGLQDDLMRRVVVANDVVFGKFDRDMLRSPRPVTAMLRYKMTAQPATAVLLDDDQLQVTFAQPQRAVTPGQAVVCYDGPDVVCGATIQRAEQ
jgi:tRNA-specific 2-thiouridylase